MHACMPALPCAHPNVFEFRKPREWQGGPLQRLLGSLNRHLEDLDFFLMTPQEVSSESLLVIINTSNQVSF